jgi:hypothetical protein
MEEEEERALLEAPAPSTVTSSTTMADDKLKRRRGQHGRHKKHDDVHVIAQVGPQGEPLQPIGILGKFSKQCSVLVKEKVPITYENWKDVPKDLKEHVWKEMLRRFTYPKGYDKVKCRGMSWSWQEKHFETSSTSLTRSMCRKGRTLHPLQLCLA